MRLEGQQQPAAREGAAGRCDHRGHLDRVMAVVVDQGELTAALCGRHWQLAPALEAPTHAAELRQRGHDRRIRQLQLGGDCDGGQRVAHVVLARQIQRHLQIGHFRAVAALAGKAHLPARQRLHVDRAHLRVLAQTVGDQRPRDQRQDRLNAGVVDADHRRAVEGHAVQEIDEGLTQSADVMAIGVHVIGVDVGHHRQHRHQVEEGGVRLVGLDHDELALAQRRVGASRVELAADHEGRVDSGFGQHAGDQRGGGGLAVSAGDGDAAAQPHQLGQHHGARHDRHMARARGQHLGVVALYGGGGDDRVGAGDMRGLMTDMDADAQFGQPARHGAVGLIGAGDGVAEVVQDLGDAAHAGTTDADEMDVLDRVLHAAVSGNWVMAGRTRSRRRRVAPPGVGPVCALLRPCRAGGCDPVRPATRPGCAR